MTWKKIVPGVFEGLPDDHDDEELDGRIRMSNLPVETIKTHRLETWKHKGKEAWWPQIKRYALLNYDHPFLTLLGTRGTGKTHIAVATGWEWIASGKTVLYYQTEDLLDALRSGYSIWQKGNPEGYSVILHFAQNVGLLIIDDLGAQNEKLWAVSKLDQIIDSRYIHRKPLIVTTNMLLDDLPDRIADRLSEGLLIQLEGESFRKKKSREHGKTE
jgi:DNA replication protein DnaC